MCDAQSADGKQPERALSNSFVRSSWFFFWPLDVASCVKHAAGAKTASALDFHVFLIGEGDQRGNNFQLSTPNFWMHTFKSWLKHHLPKSTMNKSKKGTRALRHKNKSSSPEEASDSDSEEMPPQKQIPRTKTEPNNAALDDFKLQCKCRTRDYCGEN